MYVNYSFISKVSISNRLAIRQTLSNKSFFS